MKKSLLLFAFTLLIYSAVLGIKTSNPDAQFILPPLFKITNPLTYLSQLTALQTIDFQPVRDLSFFVDLAIFRSSGIVTFATINVLLFGFFAYLMMKLLARISPLSKLEMPFYWAMIFASHPLMSQSVGWGMARKHILAAMFAVWATLLFLEWKDGKKHWLYFFMAYIASVLSHPVAILWPCWALFHLWSSEIKFTKENKKIFAIVFSSAFLMFLINFTYYKIGNPVHASIYPRVESSFTDVKLILTNFSFDLTQIFYPFRLGFIYYPDFSVAWPGFVIAALLAFAIFRRKDRQIYSWTIFGLMTIPMSVTLPGVYDTYLILPFAGMIVILFSLIDFHSQKTKIILAGMAISLGIFTHFENQKWKDDVAFNTRNFQKAKNCRSAINLVTASYGKGHKISGELMEYIKAESCFDTEIQYPVASRRIFMFLYSLMMFYEEEEFDYQIRVDRLKSLGEGHFFPLIVYAALLAREDKAAEVEEQSRKALAILKGPSPMPAPFIDQVLRPYCEKNNLPACLEITRIEPNPGYI